MTDEQYRQTNRALRDAVESICALDLDGLLSRMAYADAMGPILDPTLYRDKMDELAVDQQVARAARTMVDALPEMLVLCVRVTQPQPLPKV